jgi:branched-chain amino acid transport system substrate-binding protein
MADIKSGQGEGGGFSRRCVLQLGGGIAGATLIPGLLGQVDSAYAEDKPPLGTWPAGSQGDTVMIGATVPRTAPTPRRARTSSRACSWPSSISTRAMT